MVLYMYAYYRDLNEFDNTFLDPDDARWSKKIVLLIFITLPSLPRQHLHIWLPALLVGQADCTLVRVDCTFAGVDCTIAEVDCTLAGEDCTFAGVDCTLAVVYCTLAGAECTLVLR